jgi:hypothetical protein
VGDRLVLCTDGVVSGALDLDAVVEAARTTPDAAALVTAVRDTVPAGTLIVLERR